ncbi:MAG: ATPase [Alloprevotella sp.]
MKTLIADSGSTKTDWTLVENGNATLRVKTQGMNPLVMTEDAIFRLLREELLPALSDHPERIEFFGAGCRGKGLERMKATLQAVFGPACSVSVHSDLEGAAVALFGGKSGIACILGTGSNSGVWDGKTLVENTPSMGYILGDEGGGVSLGRRLLSDICKKQLPEALSRAFWSESGLSVDVIIEQVYRGATPNRFLASHAPFLLSHRREPAVAALLAEEFERFFRRNVCVYRRPDLPVSFIGGIACAFREEVEAAARRCELQLGQFLQAPMEGLVSRF